MAQIAVIDGNFRKDAKEVVKNSFIEGELQKRVKEFGEKYNILDIKPIDGRTLLVTYEEK